MVKESDAGKHWKKTPGAVKNPYCNDADTLNFEQTQIGAGIRLVIGEDDRSDLNVKNEVIAHLFLVLSPTFK